MVMLSESSENTCAIRQEFVDVIETVEVGCGAWMSG